MQYRSSSRLQAACTNDFWSFSSNLLSDGKATVTPNATIDSIYDYFSKSYDTDKYDSTFSCPEWLQSSPQPSAPFDDGPITMTEVIGKIKRARSKSAPSPLDGISYEIFKRCPTLWPALLDLYNCCWSSCSVPQCWKQAIIKLIPKQPAYAEPSVLNNFRPIALTPAIGKLYTNIIKDRWTSFMVKNHYWPLDTQKAFIDGVPGCLEHQFVLFEALKDARQHQRSICCCWLDFKNAFGSVPHKLIQFAIRHYHGPARVGAIVDDLYSGLESSVFFKGSITKPFPYRVGVFQGDPLSVSIFNTVTCLLNSALSSEQHLSR